MARNRPLSLLITGLSISLVTLFSSASGTSTVQSDNLSVVNAVAPSYPVFRGVPNPSGRVDVKLQLDESGNVVSARAINGHPLLQLTAKPAAQRWRFTPATTEAGERTVLVSFIFTIMPKETPAEDLTPIFSPPYQVEVRRVGFDTSTRVKK